MVNTNWWLILQVVYNYDYWWLILRDTDLYWWLILMVATDGWPWWWFANVKRAPWFKPQLWRWEYEIWNIFFNHFGSWLKKMNIFLFFRETWSGFGGILGSKCLVCIATSWWAELASQKICSWCSWLRNKRCREPWFCFPFVSPWNCSRLGQVNNFSKQRGTQPSAILPLVLELASHADRIKRSNWSVDWCNLSPGCDCQNVETNSVHKQTFVIFWYGTSWQVTDFYRWNCVSSLAWSWEISSPGINSRAQNGSNKAPSNTDSRNIVGHQAAPWMRWDWNFATKSNISCQLRWCKWLLSKLWIANC